MCYNCLLGVKREKKIIISTDYLFTELLQFMQSETFSVIIPSMGFKIL